MSEERSFAFNRARNIISTQVEAWEERKKRKIWKFHNYYFSLPIVACYVHSKFHMGMPTSRRRRKKANSIKAITSTDHMWFAYWNSLRRRRLARLSRRREMCEMEVKQFTICRRLIFHRSIRTILLFFFFAFYLAVFKAIPLPTVSQSQGALCRWGGRMLIVADDVKEATRNPRNFDCWESLLACLLIRNTTQHFIAHLAKREAIVQLWT